MNKIYSACKRKVYEYPKSMYVLFKFNYYLFLKKNNRLSYL